jgi:hypothetical protein
MRAKKLMTAEEEGGVLMLLKGEKHITASAAADRQSNASAEPSFHTLTRLDCRIYGSADSLNSKNSSRTLVDRHSNSYEQEIKVVCGNSSFLSRFIEHRINDSKLCLKIAPGTENGSEKPGGADIPEISDLVQSACTKRNSDTMSSSSCADELEKDMVSPYQFDKNSVKKPYRGQTMMFKWRMKIPHQNTLT